jgi:hypothetical protein
MAKRQIETDKQRHFQARLHAQRIAPVGDKEGVYERDAIEILDWCRENLKDNFGDPITDRDLAVLLLVSYGGRIQEGWQPQGVKGATGAIVQRFNRLMDVLARQVERLENIDIAVIQQASPSFDSEGWKLDSMEISTVLSTTNLTGRGKSYDPDEDEGD